jgi:hypothetical protein
MSGQDDTDSRLSLTVSGGRRTETGARAKRYDGLSRTDYQKRELRRAFDERWPHDTVRSAARELREPLQTVRNWHEGLTFPGGLKLLKLGSHLGLAFLARLDPEPDSELKVAAEILRRQAIEAEIARLSAQLAAPARA